MHKREIPHVLFLLGGHLECKLRNELNLGLFSEPLSVI